jgi:hypothetical protein
MGRDIPTRASSESQCKERPPTIAPSFHDLMSACFLLRHGLFNARDCFAHDPDGGAPRCSRSCFAHPAPLSTFRNLCSERKLSGRGLSLKVCSKLVHGTSMILRRHRERRGCLPQAYATPGTQWTGTEAVQRWFLRPSAAATFSRRCRALRRRGRQARCRAQPHLRCGQGGPLLKWVPPSSTVWPALCCASKTDRSIPSHSNTATTGSLPSM